MGGWVGGLWWVGGSGWVVVGGWVGWAGGWVGGWGGGWAVRGPDGTPHTLQAAHTRSLPPSHPHTRAHPPTPPHARADYFYVPVYTSCHIYPVREHADGPWW